MKPRRSSIIQAVLSSPARGIYKNLIVRLERLDPVPTSWQYSVVSISRSLSLRILQSISGLRYSRLEPRLCLLAELAVKVAEAISRAAFDDAPLFPRTLQWIVDVNTTLRDILIFIQHLSDSTPIMRLIQQAQKAALISEYHAELTTQLESFLLLTQQSAQPDVAQYYDTTHALLVGARDRDITCQRIVTGHVDTVTSVAVSSDGSKIVSGSHDCTLHFWDSVTGAEIGPPLTGHKSAVTSVVISLDGRYMVSGSKDQTIRVWDGRTGATIAASLTGHTAAVTSVGIASDGYDVVSGSEDRTIRLWDRQSGTPIGAPLTGHTATVSSVAFSPDGQLIASGSHDKTVRLWDSQTGVMYRPSRGHVDIVTSVAFSPDGRSIVSGSNDRTIRVWATSTGSQVCDPLEGHSDAVTSVVFSPDGSKIISASADGTVRLWDSRAGVPFGLPLEGHTDVVTSVACSPDMVKVVSCSMDMTLRIWHTASRTDSREQAYSEPLDSILSSDDTDLFPDNPPSRSYLMVTSQPPPGDTVQMKGSSRIPEFVDRADALRWIELNDENPGTTGIQGAKTNHSRMESVETHHPVDLSGKVTIKDGPLRGGGSCDIYLGELDRGTRAEKVAMKQLRTFLGWNDSQRAAALRLFNREVLLWSKFNHNFILPFYGFAIRNEAQFFMVSPWVNNGHCIQYLSLHPATNRRRLLWQVAVALDYLHSGGAGVPYVHGDIKGDNVLISDDGDALLCDFGLMRHVEAVANAMATPSGVQPAGHFRFAAPELLKNDNARPSPASDVFAFSGLLLQIFTGQIPFSHLKDVQALLSIMQGTKPKRPDGPEVVELGLDDALWNMANDCWDDEPSRRPTMKEITKKLETFA